MSNSKKTSLKKSTKKMWLNGHFLVTILLCEGGWEITSVEFSNEDLKKTKNRRYRM